MIMGLFIALSAAAVITLVCLTFKFILDKVRERITANRKHTPTLIDTEPVLKKGAMESAKNGEVLSLDEIERVCESRPFALVSYDEETEKIYDVEAYNPDQLDSKLRSELDKNDGILMFEGD